MRYMLLIYGNEAAQQEMTPEQGMAEMARWYKYTDDLGATGMLRAGDALQPTATATTVRGGSGAPIVSDGPFAETKEQLGGYYLIEADDLDQAIAWAKRMPNIAYGGSVEVRPIMELSDMPRPEGA